MATENDVQQTLSDIPTWLFVLVSMAGLSGSCGAPRRQG